MNIFGVIMILLVMCKYIECTQESPSFCVDLKPQIDVDIDQFLGFWYGYEIIIHHVINNNETNINLCGTIDLSNITNTVNHIYDASQQPDYRYLKLIWHDVDNEYEHIVHYNRTIQGVWFVKPTLATGNNTLTKPKLGQFTGIIQVMEAYGNQMVFTFCGKDERLFSIVFARPSKMYTADDLPKVYALLNRHGLETDSTFGLCGGSTKHNISIMSLFIALIAIIFKDV